MTDEHPELPPPPLQMLAFTGIAVVLIIVGLVLLLSDVNVAGWVVLGLGFASLTAAFVVRPSRKRHS